MSALVGRRDELAALLETLGRARSGHACWARVTGEPGIGKTRLIDELCELARAGGALVLCGRGAELERDAPFGIVVDALDDHLMALEPARRQALCAAQLGELAGVLPALAAVRPRASGGSRDERYRTYRALRTLLERLAARRPLVLALDDLQWADGASTELVSFLLRHPPAAGVLLVLASRPSQSPGLGAALAVAARDLPGTALRLDGLSERELDELLGHALDDRALATIYRSSGGNPFYAQALARDAGGPAMSGAPVDDRLPGAWILPPGELPESVAAAVDAEIRSLGGVARLVAQAASVAGERFEPALLAAAAELPEEDVLPAFDELVAADLIRAAGHPRWFVFRHPIIRRAVYDATSPGWRIAVHTRVAGVLAARAAPMMLRAHHVARCGVVGDLEAVGVLAAAAEEAQPRAPAAAAEWLRLALALLADDRHNAGRRLELLMSLAGALGALGRLREAHDTLQSALGLLAVEDPRRVGLLAGCAGVEHALGQWPQARQRLTVALEELPAAQPLAQATLCVELGVSWLHTLDYADASSWARRAAALASGLDLALHASAVALAAMIHACAEENEAAAVHRVEAATILDALGDAEVAARLDSLYYLGWAEQLLEDYPAAAAHLGRALAVADAEGVSRFLVPTMIEHAKVLAVRGRIGQALELAETAVGMARLSALDFPLLLALAAQAVVLTAAGEIDAALAAGEEALALDPAGGAGYHAAGIRRQLALSYLRGGRAERCVAELAAAESSHGTVVESGVRCLLLEARSEAELAVGDAHGARASAEHVSAAAQRLGLPASTALGLRARARVLAPESPEQGVALAREAQALFEGAGASVQAARTRVLAGEILAALGQREQALAEIAAAGRALSGFGALGFAHAARLLERRLRRTGRKATGGGVRLHEPTALTPREREVAELVARGHTNREIALRLNISQSTVETHLGSVFAKLGLRGRGAVARALAGVDGTSA